MVKHSPQILASEEKATTMAICLPEKLNQIITVEPA